jgi:hypothetical protein
MPRIARVTPPGTKLLMRAVTYLFVVLTLFVGIEGTGTAAELRPYSLPSQKMDSGQYQQRRIVEERVDESFYMKFERDSKKYDAKKKAETNAYLKNKLKKSSTIAETNHYRRLERILNGR